MKNPCGKTRKINEPYEVWRNSHGWEWRVLKKWSNPDKESSDPYARWFCGVKSPCTHGSYDLGDVYVTEIKAQAVKVEVETVEKW